MGVGFFEWTDYTIWWNRGWIIVDLRGINARVGYHEMKNGYARLQALWRSRKLQFRYNFGRDRIIGFQAMCRGYLARTQNHNKYEAVVVIQVFFYCDCVTLQYIASWGYDCLQPYNLRHLFEEWWRDEITNVDFGIKNLKNFHQQSERYI